MKKPLLLIVLPLLASGFVLAWCFHSGLLWFNNPSHSDYPVRGVDVSHHQGVIDWPLLASQNLHFVFMKATEGGDFKDTRFAFNWPEARDSGLKTGAYHFFRPGKSGREQAENFISVVPREENALPPVLDLEIQAPSEEAARLALVENIREFLLILEAHYGKKPIIYATREAHRDFLTADFAQYPLWVRSIYTAPWLDKDEWLFWQYSDHGRLEGYSGPQERIDLNVFNGSTEDFRRFAGN